MNAVNDTEDDHWDEFFEHTARGALMLHWCRPCDRYQSPEALLCSGCGRSMEWAPATRGGTVLSWTDAMKGEEQIGIALVQLAEGPIIPTRGHLADRLDIGQRVEIQFLEEDCLALPIAVPLA